MKQLPLTEDPLVLRIDFSDRGAWEKICATIREPADPFGFVANVEFVSDQAYRGINSAQVLRLVPAEYPHSFIILADQVAMSSAEFPLLVVDLYEEPGRTFRAIPAQIQGIENNLSISNMDFAEFAAAVDEDDIFRGFHNG